MVSSQDCDPGTEPDLQRDEERDRLHAVVAPVHVVPHEQVVGVRRLASDPEQLHQVVELSMNVSAHSHRTLHGLDIALFGQDLFCFLTQYFDLK